MAMIYAIHAPEAAKLTAVMAKMQALGAPIIEVVDCGDYYMALEGSHRLAAAHAIGLTPALVIRGQTDMIDVSTYDWYEAANWSETRYPAGEVAGEIFSPHAAVPYLFEGL